MPCHAMRCDAMLSSAMYMKYVGMIRCCFPPRKASSDNLPTCERYEMRLARRCAIMFTFFFHLFMNLTSKDFTKIEIRDLDQTLVAGASFSPLPLSSSPAFSPVGVLWCTLLSVCLPVARTRISKNGFSLIRLKWEEG